MMFNDAEDRPPSREKRIQALLDRKQIGVELHTREGPKRNFAILQPCGAEGPRFFIHGEALFANPADAGLYYNLQGHSRFPANYFGEEARQKLQQLLSPEGLESRLYVGKERTPQEKVAALVTYICENYPDVKLEPPADINADNLHDVTVQVTRQAEAQGVNITQLSLAEYRPDQKMREAMRTLRKQTTQCDIDTLQQQLIREGEALSHARVEALHQAVAKADWDPEVIRNFSAGLALSRHENEPIDTIIARGLQFRCDQLLHEAARQMGNPYLSDFQETMYEKANAVARAVHPRIQRHLHQRKVPLVFSDSLHIGDFAQTAGSPQERLKRAGGMWLPASTESSAPECNLIIIGSGRTQQHQLGLIRHEVEHYFDYSQPSVMAMQKSVIAQALQHDMEHLEIMKRKLESVQWGQSNESELRWFASLAEKCGFSGPLNLDSFARAKIEIDDQLDDIKSSVEYHAVSDIFYKTQRERYTEIPAIMAQLKGDFGAPIVREALPSLYKLFIRHRLGSDTLRDQSLSR